MMISVSAPSKETPGRRYAAGRGVPQDDVAAHMWLNLSAAQSTGEYREQRAKARDAVAARMTREDLSEAQRRAQEINEALRVLRAALSRAMFPVFFFSLLGAIFGVALLRVVTRMIDWIIGALSSWWAG